MSYIHSTRHYRLVSWIGDDLADLSLHIFADADFAGCNNTQKSTGGMHLVLRGPNSCFVLNGATKLHGSQSTSTPEAEIVAAFNALKSSGLPALDLWEKLLPGVIVLHFHEDNQAMIRVMFTGRNPTMKHLGRVHRVGIAWMHKQFEQSYLSLMYERTAYMAADIYTKAFNDKDKWDHACLLINIVDPADLSDIGRKHTDLKRQRILDEEEALRKERERAGEGVDNNRHNDAAPSAVKGDGAAAEDHEFPIRVNEIYDLNGRCVPECDQTDLVPIEP